jgi:TATA-box binding protein (TBP) (component of TFIID and TFIIIB)
MEVPNFDDIKISTQTIIGISNIVINTEKLFRKFTVTPYKVVEKRRGRKKKDDVYIEPEVLPDGNIITIKFGDLIRGVDVNQKKKKGKFFRNALTLVMFMDGKLINFKITKNGRFQFTGCKSIEHAKKCIQYMWEQINTPEYQIQIKLNENDKLYEYISDKCDTFDIKFLTVMTNIDFNIGFPIDREKLDEFINSQSIYNSLLETSFGYTGVNIKIRVDGNIDFDLPCQKYDKTTNKWIEYPVKYSEFVKEPSNQKYGNKSRYNTFLIFHSGNIIMSGYNTLFMKDCYKQFRTLLQNNRQHIEELLM